ncbi:CpsB/CapC family capsule biosynthesis tyrosine phosphatase [Anaerocolumna sp. MB42-C2]|uniref:CpsB/CapC family capsule biosynthesis tyrosine phosphatase n=1 Tax=Anaerocolumna sp. MB42-C2 TaxID=3070997 RepID=UPI0027DF1F92|nr:CpsB/CapC family capsule biosynthesis tyrosine phosphatase [Anaerocolumna sp. MB42-C2]WMJ85809.1 CpsB/CapC family capsule biosynthesis tyrosine phosphatase [Anaerocolumna sp. MB42-C2]
MCTNEFIDIHTHILPGVDDGAENLVQTIEMLQQAKQQGIKTIIATPHYTCGGRNKPATTLLELQEQVQMEAARHDIEIQILPGNELYYSDGILKALETGEALTLAASRYVLVEFSPSEAYQTLYRGLGQLILAGYVPILAHVERYLCLNKKEERIKDVINLGACIQMNGASLLGGFFNREAAYNKKLVRAGLVHFIASDCHNTGHRPPLMKDIYKNLEKSFDASLLQRIFLENPMKILDDKYI